MSPISGKTKTPFSVQSAVTPWDEQSLDAPVPPAPRAAQQHAPPPDDVLILDPHSIEPPLQEMPEEIPLAGRRFNAPVRPDPRPDPLFVTHPGPDPLLSSHPLTTPALRLMGDLTDAEPTWKRYLYLALALTFTGAYFFFLMSYWAPAPGRPGIDENGYLVGGRNFALHGTTGFKPADNYQFVGAMWVRTHEETKVPDAPMPGFLKRALTVHVKEGWYYPKYPLGVSVLNAAAIKTGSRDRAFLVSPICVTMAVLGIFLITRAVAGSFYGLMAMILMATGYVTLELADYPSSHAPALGFVVVGMFFLLRWWQTGKWWRGVLAGLLLGGAVTIRYTEALLLFPFFPLDQVLHDTELSRFHPHWWTFIKAVRFLPAGPLGLAVILSIRWKRVSSYFQAAVPLIAWAIPVGLLVAFNWFSMGQITGYDTTRESQGFTTGEFLKKWDFTLQQIYMYGMFLLLPLGIAGLAIAFRRSAKLGLLLTLWFLPGTLLYNAYYWGDRMPGVGFLRFFLTLFPPLIVAAMWLLYSATGGATPETSTESPRRRRGSVAGPISAGILTAATAAIGLYISLPDLERQHRGNMNLRYSIQRFTENAKPKSLARFSTTRPTTQPVTTPPMVSTGTPVIFADEGLFPQLLMDLQFMTDADCYTLDGFNVRMAGGFGVFALGQKSKDDQDAPVLLQQERIDFMSEFMKKKTAADLVNEQHRIVDDAAAAGRPVFALLTAVQAIEFKRRFITSEYEALELERWYEPCRITFSSEEDRPGRDPTARRHSPLAPSGWSGEPMIRWQPQELRMMLIRKKSNFIEVTGPSAQAP